MENSIREALVLDEIDYRRSVMEGISPDDIAKLLALVQESVSWSTEKMQEIEGCGGLLTDDDEEDYYALMHFLEDELLPIELECEKKIQ